MFGKKRKRATGIHIGDDALNVVELSSSAREGTRLEGLVRLDLDAWPLSARLSRDDVCAQLLETLKRSVRDHDLHFPSPFVALDPSLVSVKRRALIPGSADDNREQLKWEAAQFLSDDLNRYLVDFLLTRRFGFVVAVRRLAVERLRSLCEEAGISKPRFDAVPFALCNALECSGVDLQTGVDLVIDIGNTVARLVLLNEGELQALESCNCDGRFSMYGDVFADSDASHEEAAGQTWAANGKIDDGAQLLSAALDGFVDRWAGGKTPDRVWISGREADSPRWREAVASSLSIPGEGLNPFAAVEGSTEMLAGVDAPAFAIAAGLAFRGLT